MRIFAQAKVLAVEGDRERVVFGKKSVCAFLVLQTLDGSTLCANCVGKDRIAICREKMQNDQVVDFILTITGKLHKSDDPDRPDFYANDVYVKWILYG